MPVTEFVAAVVYDWTQPAKDGTKPCAWCGVAFEPRHKLHECCSPSCRAKRDAHRPHRIARHMTPEGKLYHRLASRKWRASAKGKESRRRLLSDPTQKVKQYEAHSRWERTEKGVAAVRKKTAKMLAKRRLAQLSAFALALSEKLNDHERDR